MYINSPGGVVTSGMAIYDTMQFIQPPVSTLCVGQAASMGSLLLAPAHKDMRFALPNARIMVHQPSGGFQGQATDIELPRPGHPEPEAAAERDLRQAHRPAATKTIEDALERDNFMTAERRQGLRPDRQGDRRSGPRTTGRRESLIARHRLRDPASLNRCRVLIACGALAWLRSRDVGARRIRLYGGQHLSLMNS